MIIIDERFRIPREAEQFEGFRHWVESADFPESGRIDYLAGDVEIEMSPEDLHTHGVVKAEIAARLHALAADRDLGEVFVDRARVVHPAAGLSAEPDVVMVLWSSLESGRVRYVPASDKGPGRFSEIEGAPDLLVEIVSDSSERKDTERLPRLYAAAGVPELWLVDARGGDLRFQIQTLRSGRYAAVTPDLQGWTPSPVLAARFRLVRERTRLSTWRYRLEEDPL
jgi:Uma2 family endonuclease